MSHTASLPDNDTTSMELQNSAIDHTDVESAAGAAAAVLVALPQAAAAAASAAGQSQFYNFVAQSFSKRKLGLTYSPAVYAHCCVGASCVSSCPGPRVDSAGKQCCELHATPRRLTKCKLPLHKYGAGKICRECWDGLRRRAVEPATAAAPPAADPLRSHKRRRAQSDPGESPDPAALPALTRRVTPPKPSSTAKKQYNTRREEQVMRLLEETHARRMAAEAAAAQTAGATGAAVTI